MKYLVFVWGVSSETRKEFSSSLINISIRYLLFITGTWWYFRFVNKKKNKRHITIVLYLSIKLYMWNQELYIWYEINQKNCLHLFQNEVIIRGTDGSKCIFALRKNMFLLTSFYVGSMPSQMHFHSLHRFHGISNTIDLMIVPVGNFKWHLYHDTIEKTACIFVIKCSLPLGYP